jgi:hypothetical protein
MYFLFLSSHLHSYPIVTFSISLTSLGDPINSCYVVTYRKLSISSSFFGSKYFTEHFVFKHLSSGPMLFRQSKKPQFTALQNSWQNYCVYNILCNMSIYLVFLFIYLSVSVCLSDCLSVCLFVCLCIYLPLSVFLSVHLSVYLPIYL